MKLDFTFSVERQIRVVIDDEGHGTIEKFDVFVSDLGNTVSLPPGEYDDDTIYTATGLLMAKDKQSERDLADAEAALNENRY